MPRGLVKAKSKKSVAGRGVAKAGKFKLPPMWPRVVVADLVTDDANRARVYEWLDVLDEWRVLEEIRTYVKVEKGALVRLGRILPASVKAAAAFGLRVFHLFEQVVAEVGMLNMMRAQKAAESADLEHVVLIHLQQLLDLVHESQTAFDAQARESLAGLGGCDLEPLRRFWAASGVEAGVNLAAEVGRAVRGRFGNPFLRFVPSVKEQKRRRKQTGRERPATPRDTEPDDLAILWAVQAGNRGSKEVASKAKDFGRSCSESHVRKRKMDLTSWGLLREGQYEVTDEGRAWLAELPAPPIRGGTT